MKIGDNPIGIGKVLPLNDPGHGDCVGDRSCAVSDVRAAQRKRHRLIVCGCH
jgi:hypothetical protein